MKVIAILAIFALLFGANAYTYAGHAISGDASKQIANGIRVEMYLFLKIRINSLSTLTNQATANALRADLNQPDASKRTLKSIDAVSVGQIFTAFGLKDPLCDTNKDGFVAGD